MRRFRKWRVVADWAGDSVVYRATSADNAGRQFARDVKNAFGWRPRVESMLDDSVAIRWIWDGYGKLYDGQEGFDRATWLRNPNWETVLVPLDEEDA